MTALREPERPRKESQAFVAVAICTLDRPSAIALADKLSREVHALECVTVAIFNNGASRTIEADARKLSGVAFSHDDAPGLSRARNSALRSSEADYVLYLDDDVIPPAGYLRRVVAVLEEHKPDILGAPIDPAFASEPPSWLPTEYVTRRKFERSGWRPTGSVSGGNFAVRRDIALAIGGFREGLGMVGAHMGFLEELEFALRYRASSARMGPGIYYALECALAHPMPEENTRLRYLARRTRRSHFEKGRLFAALAGPKKRRAYKIATVGAFVAGGVRRLLSFPSDSVRDGLRKSLARLYLSTMGAAGLVLGAMSASAEAGFPVPEKALREGDDFQGDIGPHLDLWAYGSIRFDRRPNLRALARLVLDAPATAIEVRRRAPGDFFFEALGFIRGREREEKAVRRAS